MENNIVVVEKLFDATTENVWRAITDKNEMKKWYFDLEDFKAEPGFKFQFTGGPDNGIQYKHLCEVTEVIPLNKLTYSWSYEGYSGVSYVTFELINKGQQTLLRLTHTGIDTFRPLNKDFILNNFREGWDGFINISLKTYLASYSTSFLLKVSQSHIYNCLLNLPAWWTETIDGNYQQKGGTFTVYFGEQVYKTMIVEELIPEKCIIWKVVHSKIDIPELNNKTEWVDTKIYWQINTKNGDSELLLSHIGLTSKNECYNICEKGWNDFTTSLLELIQTGKGRPYKIPDKSN